MYKTIASVYDYIFPQNIKQLELIEKIQPIQGNEHIIEIGCATGNLTDLLHQKTDHVIGLDLDEGLLEQAKLKYPGYSFILENMLNLNQLNQKFNKVICFGNTLVHLPNRDMVKAFFKTVYNTLEDDGYFIVQIINYNRIVEQNINHLSTIDNNHITFKRDYVHHNGYVDFNTELTIKSSDQTIINSIPLLTLTQEELTDMLSAIGFKALKFYGNLNGDKITESSVPLLMSCKK